MKSERGRHVGLGLLRERVRLAGGSLDVDSWLGEGTTLTLRMGRGTLAGAPDCGRGQSVVEPPRRRRLVRARATTTAQLAAVPFGIQGPTRVGPSPIAQDWRPADHALEGGCRELRVSSGS